MARLSLLKNEEKYWKECRYNRVMKPIGPELKSEKPLLFKGL